MAIKITTDLLKADMPYPMTNKSEKVFNQVFRLYEKGNQNALAKILEAAATYEDQPHFINLAAQYYDNEEMREKAQEMNEQLRQKFPEFIFWRINKAMDAYLEDDAVAMKELLGDRLKIEALYPQRKVFHFSEYIVYCRAVILYHGLTNGHTEMLKVLAEAQSLHGKYDFDIQILYQISAQFLFNFFNDDHPELKPVSLPPLPDYHLKEIEELYHYNLEIPEEIFSGLAVKDRTLLIEDLEKLLQHAIDHFDEFDKEDFTEKNIYFVRHALFLLVEIEASESLPAVLHFLKQDFNMVSFYLGSAFDIFLWQILYGLGQDQLRLLVTTCKEPDNLEIRNEFVETLKQVSLHRPEKRLEIESYLRELLLHASSISPDDDIFVDELIEKVLEAIGEGGFNRLFPEVKKLFDDGKLNVLSYINWQEFEEPYILKEYDSADFIKGIMTRSEIYEDVMIEESEEGEYEDEDYDDYDDDDDFEDPEDYLRSVDDNDYEDDEELENEAETHVGKVREYIPFDEVPLKPFVKTEPDVGRNDLCPCGSGKKYKKCHGKS